MIENQQKTTSILKLVSFPVGNILLALPVSYIKKIINLNSAEGENLNHLNKITIDNRQITIIDFQQKIWQTKLDYQSATTSYLILTYNERGQHLGILSLESPNLLDLPLTDIRIIPESYRHRDTLAFANHIARIEKDDRFLTLLIIDIEQLI